MKNMQYKIYAFLSLCLPHMVLHTQPIEAVCIVPIADLVGEPLSQIWPHKSVARLYHQMPAQAGSENYRISQLLFNERVQILEERCGQALISVDHQRYCTNKNQNTQTRYWVLKSQLANIRDNNKIPPAPGTHTSAQTIILTLPFYDARRERIYSFGTRFILAQSPHDDVYDVWIGPRTRIAIPQTHAIIEDPIISDAQQRQLFIKLLRSLSSTNVCVAYVWGGTSWALIKSHEHGPFSGFDCSGLAMRGAQAAGMYFPWRNSCAIAQHLAPLATNEPVKVGDILWTPGHIMVLSSINPCSLIEARTKSHGYGCVHEIPLAQEFKDIHTVSKLEQACHSGQFVPRLDANGKTINLCRLVLLRLPTNATTHTIH